MSHGLIPYLLLSLLLQVIKMQALVGGTRSVTGPLLSLFPVQVTSPSQPEFTLSSGTRSKMTRFDNSRSFLKSDLRMIVDGRSPRSWSLKSRDADLSKTFQIRGGWKSEISPTFELTSLSVLARKVISNIGRSPEGYFNACFIALFGISLIGKFGIPLIKRKSSKPTLHGIVQTSVPKPEAVKSLQLRFLVVFWLLR